jgi:metal-responsive CopG/Arc/MetJ family transcriptional regulator
VAVKKIAISVPENTLREIDLLARKVGATRSGFITQVLNEVSRAKSNAEVTARINRLLEDEEISREQKEVSEFFLRAAESDSSKGSKW